MFDKLIKRVEGALASRSNKWAHLESRLVFPDGEDANENWEYRWVKIDRVWKYRTSDGPVEYKRKEVAVTVAHNDNIENDVIRPEVVRCPEC